MGQGASNVFLRTPWAGELQADSAYPYNYLLRSGAGRETDTTAPTLQGLPKVLLRAPWVGKLNIDFEESKIVTLIN